MTRKYDGEEKIYYCFCHHCPSSINHRQRSSIIVKVYHSMSLLLSALPLLEEMTAAPSVTAAVNK